MSALQLETAAALLGPLPDEVIEDYNPICLPRISFMSGERGTGGHAWSPEDKDSPQMSLFECERDDRK